MTKIDSYTKKQSAKIIFLWIWEGSLKYNHTNMSAYQEKLKAYVKKEKLYDVKSPENGNSNDF